AQHARSGSAWRAGAPGSGPRDQPPEHWTRRPSGGADAHARLATVAERRAPDNRLRQLRAAHGRTDRQQADPGAFEGDGARGFARPQPDPALSGAFAAGAAAFHGAIVECADPLVLQRGRTT